MDRLRPLFTVLLLAIGTLLAAPASRCLARKILEYDGSVFPHTQFVEGTPDSVGELAVVGGVPGSELDDWDGFNLQNTTVANGILTIDGADESRFWYELSQHNFIESIWTNGWQIRARVRLPNARNVNNISNDGTLNPVDHPYRQNGGPHYSGYGGGHEWATHIYITQSGREDLGRLYRLNFFTDNTGDNDPIVALSQYFFEPIVAHEVQGKAGQFFTVDMINTQGRGGAVDVYIDGVLVFANNRPTAGLGLAPNPDLAADRFLIGDCCGISGRGSLSIDYVELYDGIDGLPGPFSAGSGLTNPEPTSACLLILGAIIISIRRLSKTS